MLRVLLTQERYEEAQKLMQTALSVKKGLTASHRDQLKSLASGMNKTHVGGGSTAVAGGCGLGLG